MSNAFGWGGPREGAGRPSGKASEDRAAHREDYELQRARHEKVKADAAELDLAIRRGQYLERSAVIEASATAHAVLVQSFRSIRDTLERRHSLQAEVLDAVDDDINAGLQNVALAFKSLAGE